MHTSVGESSLWSDSSSSSSAIKPLVIMFQQALLSYLFIIDINKIRILDIILFISTFTIISLSTFIINLLIYVFFQLCLFRLGTLMFEFMTTTMVLVL
ncbi:hypothetical protein PRUPE_2G000300 [Prunus persica]|uniref:Uncharacterized protein n=1 Tax=Prunus persica TaxID=3760 RepID=A0A251Q8I8_PRUPE|nr:hypothetical protein PRUPE_2G000300 [Prunus persica]